MSKQSGNASTNARSILILVPNKLRDLEGHALVAYHLQVRFGHRVFFCSEQEVHQKLLEHAPDALVLDYLGIEERVRQAALAKRLGVKVFVLPTAGFFLDREGEARRAGRWVQQSVREFVDCYFTWGNYAREVLLEYGLMSESQLLTIGCPRFDFYREPFHALMGSRVDLMRKLGIANPRGPVIMWPTGCYFVRLSNPKLMAFGNRPEAEIRAEFEDDGAEFREVSQLILALSQRHPDWNFIVKIHPSELEKPYQQLYAQQPNVKIASTVGVRELLYHCDLLLQRWSTTATEAWMLGKPVIEFTAGSYNLKEPSEYLECSDVAKDHEQAAKIIRSYLSGASIPHEQQRARESFISKLYYRVDGKAAERCAERIHELISPPNYTNENQVQTRAAIIKKYLDWKRWQDRRFANRIKDAFNIDREVSLRFWHRQFATAPKNRVGLQIKQEEIDSLHQRFSQVLNQEVTGNPSQHS